MGQRVGGRRLSFTTRYVLLFGILLLVANSALGLVVLSQSKAAMMDLIDKDMLDIVNSAAGSLDGDALGRLTEDDVDGPVFCEIKRQLLVFQNSVDIQFIYAVKQLDEDHYVFTVDPDPVDPGAFGEEVLTTPALVEASKGTPTVDSSPAADRWGNFYSAYSPVLDSSGKVAGIVGVDFDTQWYDAQVQKYTISIALVTSLSVVLAGIVVALITHRVRVKFHELDAGLSSLSENVDVLVSEMARYSGFEVPEAKVDTDQSADVADELEAMGGKIHDMQVEMGVYMDYLRMQAYTDALTKVGNSTAYHEATQGLDLKIAGGEADFWVLVYDINSLKELNDTHGHECGDLYIQGTARALVQGLADMSVYRIGGDEFVAIAEGIAEERIEEGRRSVDAAVEAFNESSSYPARLAISRGVARHIPGQDSSFRDVFARADEAMYEEKREYYRAMACHDRRRSRA